MTAPADPAALARAVEALTGELARWDEDGARGFVSRAFLVHPENARVLLAALRQREAKMRELLAHLKECGYEFHGPENMERVDAALALAPQSMEPLRALLERAVAAGEDWASDSSSYWGGTRDYDGERAAIVARVLGGGAEKGAGR